MWLSKTGIQTTLICVVSFYHYSNIQPAQYKLNEWHGCWYGDMASIYCLSKKCLMKICTILVLHYRVTKLSIPGHQTLVHRDAMQILSYDAQYPFFSDQIHWIPPSFPWHNRASAWLSLHVRASNHHWCLSIDSLLYCLTRNLGPKCTFVL